MKRKEGFPQTAMGWPVTPEALYWGPKFLYERYHKPIYITEKRHVPAMTWSPGDGRVHDPSRIAFLTEYLSQLKRAAGEIELGGYFQWSCWTILSGRRDIPEGSD